MLWAPTMGSCTTTGVHILRGALIESNHAVLLSSTSVPFLINRTPQTDTAPLLSPLQRTLSSPFSPWCKPARHHIMTCRVGQQICQVLVPLLFVDTILAVSAHAGAWHPPRGSGGVRTSRRLTCPTCIVWALFHRSLPLPWFSGSTASTMLIREVIRKRRAL